MKEFSVIKHTDIEKLENKKSLQRGMHFCNDREYSILLMGTHDKALYEDKEINNNEIIYTGHNIRKTKDITDPNKYDQPMYNKNNSLSENGLFYTAAQDYKNKVRNARIVHLYEKINRNQWIAKGNFFLIDSKIVTENGRNVFKFYLKKEL